MKSRFAGSKGLRVPAALFVLISIGLLRPAAGEGLSVSPINVAMAPGQMATVINLGNQGNREISFQIRAFTWQQTATDDPLSPTEELFVSPPLGTIAPGATQVARLVLRQAPREREATYRILVDELPPPAEAGSVRVAIRLSIPVFAEPANRVAPRVTWRVTVQGTQGRLAATNDGTRHLTVRNIALHSADGRTLQVEGKLPPHVLAGGARQWPISTHGPLPGPGSVLRLTADTDIGTVDEQVRVDAGP